MVCRVRAAEADAVVDVECRPPRIHSVLLGSGLVEDVRRWSMIVAIVGAGGRRVDDSRDHVPS